MASLFKIRLNVEFTSNNNDFTGNNYRCKQGCFFSSLFNQRPAECGVKVCSYRELNVWKSACHVV